MLDVSLDEVLDPSFVDGLERLEANELRRRKELADAHEAALSYARRILQGKIDLLAAELQARREAGGEVVGPSIADLSEVLEPKREREFRGRFPRMITRPETPEVQEAERTAAHPIFARLEEASVDEIAWVAGRLRDHERRISDLRLRLHSQIDQIERELVRRYTSGEISVDDVLKRYVTNGS